MDPSLTDALCTRCGLCCDGSLFADVELAGRSETAGLEILGLEVEDDDGVGLLVQPCRALQGRRCGIYAHRPACCRTFECGLLQDARSGAISVERAQKHIAETIRAVRSVKELLVLLGRFDRNLPLRECGAEALAVDPARHPAVRRRQVRLGTAIERVEHLIRDRFLKRGTAGRDVVKTRDPS
ncbi:MAG: YkgJ family cysteine cluster protein [Candidatus Eisenbacteria bacterium]